MMYYYHSSNYARRRRRRWVNEYSREPILEMPSQTLLGSSNNPKAPPDKGPGVDPVYGPYKPRANLTLY
eukprot:5568808-Pyramimonas_sp.AAC.1